MALLDAETEWSYDASTRRIHLASLGDADPAGLRVAARVQEYAIAATDCSHLRFSGLGFFATALYAAGESNAADQDLHDVTFDSLIFDFPSAQKRLLGDGARSWPVTLLRKRTDEQYGAANLTLFNCSFYGAEAHPQVNSQGSGVLFAVQCRGGCGAAPDGAAAAAAGGVALGGGTEARCGGGT